MTYTENGSTKADDSVQYLNEVLDACQNAGPKVIAALCDMGANSVKALKLLDDTTRKPFFRFHSRNCSTI
jgi:hypothetical protein